MPDSLPHGALAEELIVASAFFGDPSGSNACLLYSFGRLSPLHLDDCN